MAGPHVMFGRQLKTNRDVGKNGSVADLDLDLLHSSVIKTGARVWNHGLGPWFQLVRFRRCPKANWPPTFCPEALGNTSVSYTHLTLPTILLV